SCCAWANGTARGTVSSSRGIDLWIDPLAGPIPSLTTGAVWMPDPAQEAFDAAFLAAYGELRRLAAHMQRNDPAVTFDPTGLVNAAWLKLAGTPELAQTTPLHFKRIAARAMRQILVEAARKRTAEKRGGGSVVAITLDEGNQPTIGAADEVIALHEALERSEERRVGKERRGHA